MRAPNDLNQRRRRDRRPNRGRILLIALAILLFFLVISARGIAAFYTDWLWFRSLDKEQVFTGVIGARVALSVIFTALFAVILWINLLVAERAAPAYRPTSADDAFIERYHQLVGRRRGLVRAGTALFFGVVAGVGTASQWRSWLLFTHHVSFGISDELFNTDIGFYVFQLPFLSFVVGWLFNSIVIVLVVTTVAHYLNGGIRLQVQGQRVTPQVKAHLSVLLGVLALLRAAGYYLERFHLTLSARSEVIDGAGYTDVKAQLPALNLLILISLFAAALLVINIFRRGWVLPGIAVGLWGLVAVVAGTIYPAVIQKLQVESQTSRELPYIERNISATRAAYGLSSDNLVETQIAPEASADAATAANEVNVDNLFLIDPSTMEGAFRTQNDVGFYIVDRLDFGRYKINDVEQQVVIGVRELNQSNLPTSTWENTHLAYTHGHGVVVAPANKVLPTGGPDYTAIDLGIEVPEIYFGERIRSFGIVNTSVAEISDAGTTSYSADSGVRVGGFFRRVAYALRFWDRNLLFSGKIDSDSRVLYVRDVVDRVKALAPFLDYDADPYPVVVNGRVLWVIDAYTTTDKYPYSQRSSARAVGPGSGLDHDFNYVRNSVKAVVDAYTGDATFYVVDDTDPLLRSFRKAFPKLFTPVSEAGDELRYHFRYGTDLFKTQTEKWGTYHIESAQEFLSSDKKWQVAVEPGRTQQQSAAGTTAAPVTSASARAQVAADRDRFDPYYQLLRQPKSNTVSYSIVRPLVPVSREDSARVLAAFMVGTVGADGTPRINVLEVSGGSRPGDPSLVAQNQQSQFSAEFTLLDQQGSKVEFGPMQLVPIGDSIVYVRSQYVKATGANSPNQLRNILATTSNGHLLKPNIEQFLTAAYNTPATGNPPPSSGPTTPGNGANDAARAVADASQLLREADAALRSGDLAGYQTKVNEARRVLENAGVRQASTTPGSSTTVPPRSTGTSAPATTAAPTTAAPTTAAPTTSATPVTVAASTSAAPSPPSTTVSTTARPA